MGYDLENYKGDYFRFRYDVWPIMLQLAKSFGWEPEGVESMICDDEDIQKHLKVDEMDYMSNSYQTVKEGDANKIADALEKALEKIPETNKDEEEKYDIIAGMKVERIDTIGESIRNAYREFYHPTVDPLEYFSGSGRELIKEFISFCRKGAFIIG